MLLLVPRGLLAAPLGGTGSCGGNGAKAAVAAAVADLDSPAEGQTAVASSVVISKPHFVCINW